MRSKPPTPVANRRPEKLLGHPTAGTPTVSELGKAAAAGKLKVNKAGAITTPKVRQAGKQTRQAKAIIRKARPAKLPYLDAEGQRVARKVLGTGKRLGRSRKDLIAAAETGIVESGGFHNLPGGDADSQGWRQERTSIFGAGPTGARNVKAGARRFYSELPETALTPGEAAQGAQGSAFPERYDEHAGEAKAIVNAFERGKRLTPAQRRKIARANAAAQAAGIKGVATSERGGGSVGPAPKKLVTRVVAAEHAMHEVAGLPYVWGGGHGAPHSEPTGGGLDCSGSVGYVLNKIGAMHGSATSGEMGRYLKPGPGALTVFYNSTHTFLRLIDKHGKAVYWGTSVGDSGAGGLGPHPTPSRAYLAQYNVGHVPGMGRKQALQLGYHGDLSSPGSFPGMTLSADGTTATIDSGTGATISGKPGFSKSPIRVSPAQRARRTLREIHNLGRKPASPAAAEKGPELARLEKTYGVAAV